ncbi:MAG: hypothetical protein IKQ46_18725 [Bacteroidales bacterium]|nr:hypothetical protein [Bacteroidales bacterium]MBR4268074.1 hypothetical protein [Bacteroidales bacterium]
MKHLIILDFVKNSVDFIKISDKTAAENDKNDCWKEFIWEYLDYSIDNIEYMVLDDVKINQFEEKNKSLTTIKEYIFLTNEGNTTSPNDQEIHNCQYLGRAKGKDVEEARANLLKENKWIKESGYDINDAFYEEVVPK